MLLPEAEQVFRQHLGLRDKSPVTIDNYVRDLKRFNEWYVARFNLPCDVSEVTESVVEEYLSYLKNYRGISAVSRNRELNTLKSFYKMLTRKRIVQFNPVLDIDPAREQKKERVYITEEEFDRLVAAITSPIVRVFVTALFHTGMRVSEATGLTIGDVDLDSRVIHVIAGKGNKNRNIPINDTLYTHLKKYHEAQRFDAESWQRFFATESTGRLSSDYVTAVLKRACTKAGITKNVTPHVLRHSFASLLVKKGVSVVFLQKLLGHSSLATTSVYTHANMEDLVSAVNTLNQ